MWYACDELYAVLYGCLCCFVVRGCAVSRRYLYVCYCDMFRVVKCTLTLIIIISLLTQNNTVL